VLLARLGIGNPDTSMFFLDVLLELCCYPLCSSLIASIFEKSPSRELVKLVKTCEAKNSGLFVEADGRS